MGTGANEDKVVFCTTNDGSAGLYNFEVDDIYHSSYGAYRESMQKFIEASGFKEFIVAHDSVRVLDVCYGIGYNSKTALNEILKLDKIISAEFDCLEYDKNLVNISPLLKKQKVDNFINEFLIKNSNLDKEYSFWKVLKFFHRTNGFSHLNWQNLALMGAFLQNCGSLLLPLLKITSKLHNIYYNYIPFRIKNDQKARKLAKTTVKFHTADARKSISGLQGGYNFIFLDAFTPKKLPTLWSYEFLKQLYNLLNADGVLITYSSSAAVRAAMVEIGFKVGKSVDKNNKIIGTVAAKDENLIKYNLDDFERDLLMTTAGIYYKDENLTASCDELIERREREVKTSDRMTSSRLKKNYAKKI